MSSSTITVCSCGALSEGSICSCLVKRKEFQEEDIISTEHFYKEQNAEIFVEDSKNVIYEDQCITEKRLKFDETAKGETEVASSQFKFYGMKDAIRDEKALAKMKKRIYKCEHGGEYIEKEGDNSDDSDKKDESETKTIDGDVKEPKFHISIEGVSYDIIGDQDGLENLDEMRKNGFEDSSATFRKMYSDEIKPSLQILSLDADRSSSSTLDHNLSLLGEDMLTLNPNYKDLPELTGESNTEKTSLIYLGEASESVWGEDHFEEKGAEKEVEGEEEHEKTSKVSKKKRKREGIPQCCMCRCIVPEGLSCCPCGATTVVEVFKKESMEVFVENEDDLTFRIEVFESRIPPESIPSSEISMEAEEEQEIIKKDLPPESFFPFSPKWPNKFSEKNRPEELTKDYVKSLLKRPQKNIPEKCIELLNLAKIKIEENERKKEEEKENLLEDPLVSEFSSCGETEEKIKTDFSDLKLFIPNEIENWRMTVQKKYKEWFYKGPQIRDESYYDIAIDEISEDEYEVDKQLEQYFEN